MEPTEYIEDIDSTDNYHEAIVATNYDILNLENADNELDSAINRIKTINNIPESEKDNITLVATTESLKYSIKLLGVDDSKLTQPYNISRESLDDNIMLAYELATEGVKEFLDTVINTISNIYNKIVNGVKFIIEKIKYIFSSNSKKVDKLLSIIDYTPNGKGAVLFTDDEKLFVNENMFMFIKSDNSLDVDSIINHVKVISNYNPIKPLSDLVSDDIVSYEKSLEDINYTPPVEFRNIDNVNNIITNASLSNLNKYPVTVNNIINGKSMVKFNIPKTFNMSRQNKILVYGISKGRLDVLQTTTSDNKTVDSVRSYTFKVDQSTASSLAVKPLTVDQCKTILTSIKDLNSDVINTNTEVNRLLSNSLNTVNTRLNKGSNKLADTTSSRLLYDYRYMSSIVSSIMKASFIVSENKVSTYNNIIKLCYISLLANKRSK